MASSTASDSGIDSSIASVSTATSHRHWQRQRHSRLQRHCPQHDKRQLPTKLSERFWRWLSPTTTTEIDVINTSLHLSLVWHKKKETLLLHFFWGDNFSTEDTFKIGPDPSPRTMFRSTNITPLPKQYIAGLNTITVELKILSKLFNILHQDIAIQTESLYFFWGDNHGTHLITNPRTLDDSTSNQLPFQKQKK